MWGIGFRVCGGFGRHREDAGGEGSERGAGGGAPSGGLFNSAPPSGGGGGFSAVRDGVVTFEEKDTRSALLRDKEMGK